ncbi:hypothetical protein RRF57_013252 [Xylaria bambusicola]|uniref:Uncharacterized protein n=1 Tax=Xylaria bambusicola TaxID=326684 RepID=A0AAN7ZBC1_9PEZI
MSAISGIYLAIGSYHTESPTSAKNVSIVKIFVRLPILYTVSPSIFFTPVVFIVARFFAVQ